MQPQRSQKLEDIGFYTLSDNRAKTASSTSRLMRCELLLTARCNFKCPYCRGVGGPDLPYEEAERTVRLWAADGLYAIRFSGGEPTIYPHLKKLVTLAKTLGIKKIAVSTNGSRSFEMYKELVDAGVNDFSISLDACCAEDGDKMAGGIRGAFNRVVNNIEKLSKISYVTVGVVLTEANMNKIDDIISFASGLGVTDIRIIPAAQDGNRLCGVSVNSDTLNKFPILNYRIQNIKNSRPVRGLSTTDSTKCGLILDDIAACEGKHYACIIHMREGGKPIGLIGENMRQEREDWYHNMNTHNDPICSKNCLDVCVDYNNKFRDLNEEN